LCDLFADWPQARLVLTKLLFGKSAEVASERTSERDVLRDEQFSIEADGRCLIAREVR
jgi:hypothetical protein